MKKVLEDSDVNSFLNYGVWVEEGRPELPETNVKGKKFVKALRKVIGVKSL